MAEAGDKDNDKKLHPNVEREIDEILRKTTGEDASSLNLNKEARKDVEEAIARAEGETLEIPAPKAEEIKTLYKTLSDSLEKLGIKAQPKDLESGTEIKPVSVEGLGEVTMYFTKQVAPSPESKIIVVVQHPESKNGDLVKRIISVGSEGRSAFYQDSYKHGGIMFGDLYSNAGPTFLNVRSVVTAIERAANTV